MDSGERGDTTFDAGALKECDIVDCGQPRCLEKCGFFQWFGNLSNCHVLLQYQLAQSNDWHTLGTFGPGEHIDLSQGALYLPNDAKLRVIRQSDGQLVTDYGEIGRTLKSIFVDSTFCSEDTAPGGDTGLGDKRDEDAPKQKTPIWVWIVVTLGSVFLGVLLMFTIYMLYVKKKRHVFSNAY